MSKGTGTILEFILSWYEQQGQTTRSFAKDDDTAVTYPLGSRSTSSMEDYGLTTSEEEREDIEFGKPTANDDTAAEDGVYVSLDTYTTENWRACRARFRKSKGDLLSDKVNKREEMHMTLPTTPTRATMPPFSVYYGMSKEDMEWRRQGKIAAKAVEHQGSRIRKQPRGRRLRLPRRGDADKLLFMPSAHAA